ncbi:unnamed protein product, partial [Polarella glacialis]
VLLRGGRWGFGEDGSSRGCCSLSDVHVPDDHLYAQLGRCHQHHRLELPRRPEPAGHRSRCPDARSSLEVVVQ